ncbi:MAG TPA: hypothetical protein VNP04_21575 [Alphaproteobacteria bacterium]|nr:hypothetical protein [Alphaproteobacteria bacterium]
MADVYEEILAFLLQEYLLGYLLVDPNEAVTVGFIEHLADFIAARTESPEQP